MLKVGRFQDKSAMLRFPYWFSVDLETGATYWEHPSWGSSSGALAQ